MNQSNSNWVNLAKAFTTAYAICYIISPILGLRLAYTDPIISSIGLILIGLGLLFCIHTRNTFVIISICAFEAVGCVAHYLKIIPWIPAFSDTSYIVMSLLDLIQIIFLFALVEEPVFF